jgi:hypothetical protein
MSTYRISHDGVGRLSLLLHGGRPLGCNGRSQRGRVGGDVRSSSEAIDEEVVDGHGLADALSLIGLSRDVGSAEGVKHRGGGHIDADGVGVERGRDDWVIDAK